MGRHAITLMAALLAGCGSDGGGAQPGPAACASLNTSRSHIDSNCIGCTIAGAGDVADGHLFSFADVTPTDSNFTATIRAGNGGTMLPSGTRAGAFLKTDVVLGGPTAGHTVTLRTYLAGALAESPATADVEDTRGGTDADYLISFVTAAPFDAVEVSIVYTDAQELSSADVRVYELCSDGNV